MPAARRRTVLLTSALSALLLVSLTAAPASAHPLDGTDPTGCAGSSYVVASWPIKRTSNGANVGTLELRYSTSCKTNWVRINNKVSGSEAVKHITRVTNGYFHEEERDWATGWSYSMQVYAPGSTCVIVEGYLVNGDGWPFANAGGIHEVC